MKKRLILYLLVFIFLISFVNAVSKTYNILTSDSQIPQNTVQLQVYGCGSDSLCLSPTSLWASGNTILPSNQITISGNPESYNAEFFYDSIDCYPPISKYGNYRPSTWYNGELVSLNLKPKQSSCTSSTSNLNVIQNQNVLTISFDLAGINYDSQLTNINLPSQVKPWYDSQVKILLYVNNQEISSKTRTEIIPKDGKTGLSFTYTLDSGNYDIKVKSQVIDCKCTQPQGFSESSTNQITISCNPNIQYTSWGNCDLSNNNYIQNRTRYDTNKCSLNVTETQDCTCPSWSSGSWSDCYQNKTDQYLRNLTQTKTNPQCTDQLDKNVTYITCNPNAPSTCSDGTQNRMCSRDTKGKYCIDGNLVDECDRCGCSSNKICLKNDKCTSCTPNWETGKWSECRDYQRQRSVSDKNSCDEDYSGTNYEKPKEEEYCDESSTQTTEADSDLGSDIIVPAQTNKFEFSLGSGIYWLIGLIIFSLGMLTLFLYFLNKPKPAVKEEKKEIKEELKKVNITGLLKTTIDSLDEDGKAICNKLIEGEGIRQDSLRNMLSIPKPRMELALSKLERRQIIKEREGENPRIFFNDWLK